MMEDLNEKQLKSSETIRAFLEKNHAMDKPLVCALSGGADSVYLLYTMVLLSRETPLELACIHVHHGIRGADADADEAFCRNICAKYNVPLTVYHVDTPLYAAREHLSLESAARILRYEKWNAYLSEHPHCRILTAHNATDQAETVLFRMARGTGLTGLVGIPPKRECFLRPMLHLTREEIRSFLSEQGIPYCTDNTNTDMSYTRNRVRGEVLPALEKVHSNAVAHISYMVDSLREDSDYLWEVATKLLSSTPFETIRPVIREQHPAIAKRMIMGMCRMRSYTSNAIPREHIHEIYRIACSDTIHAEIALPNHLTFHIDRELMICQPSDKQMPERQDLKWGVNILEGRQAVLILSRDPIDIDSELSPFIYKFVIQKTFAVDIISQKYYIRSKLDGDAYRYGGMTHKVKQLFKDNKLSMWERRIRPVLCDDRGILWIPGFEPREKTTLDTHNFIYVCYARRTEVEYD